MLVQDLGLIAYRDAWAIQESIHAQVLAGAAERLLLLEHKQVITFGRRPGISRNLIASDSQLSRLGVEIVQSDRGGDITYHGPGQLVAYPIVRLADHKLSVGAYIRRLQEVIVAALHEIGIESHLDPKCIGVWVSSANRKSHIGNSKICSLGVRIRRGVSLHGIALNVSTD